MSRNFTSSLQTTSWLGICPQDFCVCACCQPNGSLFCVFTPGASGCSVGFQWRFYSTRCSLSPDRSASQSIPPMNNSIGGAHVQLLKFTRDPRAFKYVPFPAPCGEYTVRSVCCHAGTVAPSHGLPCKSTRKPFKNFKDSQLG